MESYYYRAFKLSPYRTYAQPPIFDGSENGLKLSINRYARHSKETSLDFSVDNAIIESSYRIPNISPVHKSRGGCADCKGLINDNYIEHLKIFYQILQEEENELLPPVSDNKVNKRNEMNMIEPPYKYIQPTTAAMPRSFFKRPDTPYNFDRSIDRFSSGAQSAESLEKNVGVQRVSRPKSLDKHTSTVQNVSVFTNEEPGLVYRGIERLEEWINPRPMARDSIPIQYKYNPGIFNEPNIQSNISQYKKYSPKDFVSDSEPVLEIGEQYYNNYRASFEGPYPYENMFNSHMAPLSGRNRLLNDVDTLANTAINSLNGGYYNPPLHQLPYYEGRNPWVPDSMTSLPSVKKLKGKSPKVRDSDRYYLTEDEDKVKPNQKKKKKSGGKGKNKEPSVSDSTEASEDLEDYLTSSDEDEDDEKPKPKRKSKSEKKMDTDIKPSSPSIKSKAKSKHSQDANKEVRPSFSHKPVIEKSPETKADHRNLPKSIHDDGAISGIDPSSLLLKDKVTEGFKPDIPPAYAIQEGAPIKNSSQHIAQSPKKLTSTPKNMSAGFSSDVSLPSSNTSQFKIAKETEVQTKFQLPNHPTLTSQEQFDVINKSKKLGNFKMKKPHIGSNIVIKTLPSANTKTV
ncbi:uncharacterized protein LOC135923280 [Gordionus sp. m RMFG-2023]|uniref:uncharacterized protein LOC135923280 n=1 Tax=Gordionus sp. m RMFG-2023 TaxID=3053472 RepID=UPI0031FDA5C2